MFKYFDWGWKGNEAPHLLHFHVKARFPEAVCFAENELHFPPSPISALMWMSCLSAAGEEQQDLPEELDREEEMLVLTPVRPEDWSTLPVPTDSTATGVCTSGSSTLPPDSTATGLLNSFHLVLLV